MEIIIIWPYELSISNRARYQRIKTLSEHYNVHLVTMMQDKIDSCIRGKLERVIRTPLMNRLSYLLYPFALIYTVTTTRIKHKDVMIYVFYNWTIIFAIMLCLIYRLKLFVDFLDDPNLMVEEMRVRNRKNFKYYTYSIINYLFKNFAEKSKNIIGFCAIGLSNNSILPNLYSKRYSIKSDRIITVPNGSDISFIHSVRKLKRNRILRIIFVTHIGPQRQVDVLIDNLEKIEGFEFELILIGKPMVESDNNWLRKLINEHKWISYKGELPHKDVLSYIATSDVGVFMASKNVTNYRYTHPIKVVEYLALGKPVIAPRFEGVMEIVKDGYNGFLFDPDHPEGIIDIITKNKESIVNRELSLNALQSVKQFDWKLINKKYMKEFQRLVYH